MNKFKRIIIIILDSVGCGVQRDYKKYQKQRSNTLLSIYNYDKAVRLPNLENLGLTKILFDREPKNKCYCAGKIRVKTAGNDTLASVWEMLGVKFPKRYRSYKRGFSKKTVDRIERALETPILGNEYIASRKAFKKYYYLHKETGFPLLYLADDGVVLLSAHENVIPLEKLNALGAKLTQYLGHENVIRVIVRPFAGTAKNPIRKHNDCHYPVVENMSLVPLVYYLQRKKIRLITTSHIHHILGKPRYTRLTKEFLNNKSLLKNILDDIKQNNCPSLMVYCLQEFDRFGHKKDPRGYGKKLMELDKTLPTIIKNLKKDDLLILVADHGCDPTVELRGHTREFVPIMLYFYGLNKKIWLKTRNTLSDVGQTICHNFSLTRLSNGYVIEEIFK